jgi:UDP-N-acetylglucosamine 2-epimerase
VKYLIANVQSFLTRELYVLIATTVVIKDDSPELVVVAGDTYA